MAKRKRSPKTDETTKVLWVALKGVPTLFPGKTVNLDFVEYQTGKILVHNQTTFDRVHPAHQQAIRRMFAAQGFVLVGL